MQLRTRIAIVASMIAIGWTSAYAALTPEEDCRKSRAAAAVRYNACQQKAVLKHFGGDVFSDFPAAAHKCAGKYRTAWTKIQARASGTGSSCDVSRFVDTGSTVVDNLTGLEWEKKTDDGGIHDRDDVYEPSAGGGGYTASDGDAYTSFLATLNTGACFGGQCDWRLPTLGEVLTIIDAPFPECPINFCMNPVFGVSAVDAGGWSSTPVAGLPPMGWMIDFRQGALDDQHRGSSGGVLVVRGGL